MINESQLSRALEKLRLEIEAKSSARARRVLEMRKDSNFLLTTILWGNVAINVLLALFNLIPIPPLDGGRILVGLLPREQAVLVSRVEPYGMFLVVGLIFLNSFGVMSYLWRFMSLLTRTLLGM